jgi:curved DNA-binding protein
LQRAEINHYATLGLDCRCTLAQIRAAYRVLAKQHHPDLNPNSPAAVQRTQELNAAHETLSDHERRSAYDRELDAPKKPAAKTRAAKIERNISQDVNLRPEDFLRGTTREVRVNDPANPNGPEIYELIIPPDTAPGTRFRLPRAGSFAGGFVQLRVKALPGFRFKVRGSDLRCDLKISSQRAVQGGTEMIRGLTGAMLRVPIPRGVGRNEIVRVPNEGLPRPRGGRGDLLVRITYRIAVRVTRPAGR